MIVVGPIERSGIGQRLPDTAALNPAYVVCSLEVDIICLLAVSFSLPDIAALYPA